MGATSPERHREVAVTPFQSDLGRAIPRCRSRLHHPERRGRSDTARSLAISDPERRDWSDTARSLAKSGPERRLAATPPGRSRSLERPPGATNRGRGAPSVCSNSFLLKGLLVISLCTFLLLKTYVLSTFGSHQTDYLCSKKKPLESSSLESSLFI
ncbi:unnamed protein product [Brassica napus]|uniref:(rape) hypothetical protein n=1 Tax=Brassica napus TaxID=3708 RepID=A0A816JJ37_BRANA|nr:unnamed protein product [Brassica napus]